MVAKDNVFRIRLGTKPKSYRFMVHWLVVVVVKLVIS